MSIEAISSNGGGYNYPSISEMRQKMFTMMDQDGDGSISQSECETAANDMSQKAGVSITADQMMSIFDLDQDGVITQSEQSEASPEWEQYMASRMEESGMRPMGPPPPPPETSSEMSDLVDQIISAIDTDGDGVISQTEYEAAMEELGEQTDSAATSAASSDTSTSSSTSETAAAASSEAASASEETSLSALLAQFLEMVAKMQEDTYSQYSQESQYQSVNSYA